jgi:hypothetical protein
LTGEDIAAGACQGASNCTKTLPKYLQMTLEEIGGGGFFFGASGTVVGVRK